MCEMKRHYTGTCVVFSGFTVDADDFFDSRHYGKLSIAGSGSELIG